MKAVNGNRTLPNAREVQRVLNYLGNPKTLSQICGESGMHPSKVRPAIRILCARHLIVEVGCDPDVFVRVGA